MEIITPTIDLNFVSLKENKNMEQSAKNYLRFYPPHHFIFYPFVSILLGISIYRSIVTNDTILWAFLGLILLSLLFLSLMMRQHYALTLQDRIIRLEIRYRFFSLTGQRFETFEPKLNDSQIFSLRFCSDAELPEMVQKVLDENLSGSKIKQSIHSWKNDDHRV